MISVDPAHPHGIVWLASYPKSGNTWVRAFIYVMYGLLTGSALSEVNLDRMAEFGESDRDVRHYQQHLARPATTASRAEVAEARLKVQADIAAANHGVVLVKTHNALVDDAGFPTINPAASAGGVYVVRNPLDVAVSYAHFFALSFDQAIDRLAENGYATRANDQDVHFINGSWSEHVASWTRTSDPTTLVVRYEDMLERPSDTFGSIARHVMMPHDPPLLERAIDLTSFDRLQKTEIAHGFVEKPPEAKLFFRAGRAGQWREALTDGQVQRVVAAHGDVMRKFGYLPS